MSRRKTTRLLTRSHRSLPDVLSIANHGWRPAPQAAGRFRAIPQDARLRREGIHRYRAPIHLQSREWLVRRFGPGKNFPVNVNVLMKNIIWQVRERILAEEQPPVRGLIRSFWYTYIKPALARAGALSSEVDQYPQMIKMFVRLVQYAGLMRYRDFGFVDDNENDRRIGVNSHVILFAEKAGHYPLLELIAEDTEATILSLGGQPSLLSAEYFVDEMSARGINIQKSFYTFSLVDYDPSGWIIRNAFLNDLRFFLVKHIQHTDLILPAVFSQEEIRLNKYPLPDPPEMASKNSQWLRESGGIDGKLYGLEADAAPADRIRELFLAGARDLIESTEEIRKARALASLAEALQQYALAKLRTQEA